MINIQLQNSLTYPAGMEIGEITKHCAIHYNRYEKIKNSEHVLAAYINRTCQHLGAAVKKDNLIIIIDKETNKTMAQIVLDN